MPKRTLPGIALVVLVALATVVLGCGASAPDEDQRGSGDPQAVESPTPNRNETQEFVPDTRTFRIIPDKSEARYEVDEELTFLGIALNRAIGRTSQLSGEFSFYRDGTDDDKLVVSSGHFQVDISTLTSNDTRRDERIRNQWLESARFPLAAFEAKEVRNPPIVSPDEAGKAVEWTFDLKGDMTVREVTREETFEIHLNLIEGKMVGTASALLKMKDYGFKPPSIPGLFKVEEGVLIVLEFQAEEVSP